jgi:predicted tellurium resistance membrane protein TerC
MAKGGDIAAQFLTGYLLEFSLSLDNVFVFALILGAYSVPAAYATPLLAVRVVIEATDLIFALDSIPAIFGVTREPFIVFSATALALVGLRSMYFLLAGARDRFVYLDIGLAVILIFVGAKFVLTEVVPVGVGVSLLVIVGVIGAAIAASLLRSRRAPGALARTPRLAPRRRARCRRRTTRRASYR